MDLDMAKIRAMNMDEFTAFLEKIKTDVHEQLHREALEMLKTSEHRVYAVYFDNGRIKVGYTSNFAKRIEYYVQEARRHGGREVRYWASCT